MELFWVLDETADEVEAAAEPDLTVERVGKCKVFEDLEVDNRLEEEGVELDPPVETDLEDECDG